MAETSILGGGYQFSVTDCFHLQYHKNEGTLRSYQAAFEMRRQAGYQFWALNGLFSQAKNCQPSQL